MNRKWLGWGLGLTLLLSCSGASGQNPEDGTRRLTVHLGRPSGGAGELRLLPGAQEMTDGDALALYAKVFEAMPKDLDWERIRAWRQVPLQELPLEEIRPLLRRAEPGMRLLEQACRCKRCDWPLDFEDGSPVTLQACRNVVFLLALQARFQLAQGDHASCVRTLSTGFALVRHLEAGSSLIHVLVGAAIGAVLCDEIELYVQQPRVPSLEAALQAIPSPWFHEKHSDIYGLDDAGRSRAVLLLMRMNRRMAAVRYVELLRRYAGEVGTWPQTLDEVKADLPDDPVAGKPFVYERISETRAVFSGPLPEGGGSKDVVRYELNLVK